MYKILKLYLKPLIRQSLTLGYPFILFVILGFFIIPLKDDYIKEVGVLFLFTAIGFGFVTLIGNAILKKWALAFTLLIVSLFSGLKLIFYSVFSVKISASSLFVLFETNKNEASEFLSSYINSTVIAIVLLLCIPFLVFFVMIFSKKKGINSFKIKYQSLIFKGVIVVLMLSCVYVLNRSLKEHSLIFTVSKSIKEYQQTKLNVLTDLAQPTNANISIITRDSVPKIGVIIIGEATSRWHMGLYGYNRETNPLLTEIKEDLFVFKDAIAPHVMTIRSLEKNLTLNSFETLKHNTNFSIIQLANAASFNTYWISNQEPVGFTESIPTIIGSAANQTQFLTTNSYNYSIYDENVLPELKQALESDGDRKLIVLHLIGTHRLYKKRYPQQYNYFSGVNERTKFKTKYSKEQVNEYDNAVRYNDFIIRQIIETVKAENRSSFVVYFSDHGDEVFDTIDFVGHHGDKATRPMHDVPFIAWFSKAYKNENQKLVNAAYNNVDKPYALEDFMHSFSDLISVKAKDVDSTKSIFNAEFKVKTRQLRNDKLYDNL